MLLSLIPLRMGLILFLFLNMMVTLLVEAQTISTFAGGASDLVSLPVTSAFSPNSLNGIRAISLDGRGGLYISTDSSLGSSCVRRLNLTAIPPTIKLIVGNCYTGSTAPTIGDGLVANNPLVSKVGGTGNGAGAGTTLGTAVAVGAVMATAPNSSGVFIADTFNRRLRYVDTSKEIGGLIHSVASNGSNCCHNCAPSTTAEPATASTSCLGAILSLAWGGNGESSTSSALLLLADFSYNVIRSFSPSLGTIRVIAGTGFLPSAVTTGNTGLWLNANITPVSLVVNTSSGLVYFIDAAMNTIRALATDGTVRHIAGSNGVGIGSSTLVADGAVALTATFGMLSSLAIDGVSRLIFIEGSNNIYHIRYINAMGLMASITNGFSNAALYSDSFLVSISNVGLGGNGGYSFNKLAFDNITKTTYAVDHNNGRVRALYSNGTSLAVFGPTSLGNFVSVTTATSLQLAGGANGINALAYEPLTNTLIASSSSSWNAFNVATGLTVPTLSGGSGAQRLSIGNIPGPIAKSTLSLIMQLSSDGLGNVFGISNGQAYNYSYVVNMSASAGMINFWNQRSVGYGIFFPPCYGDGGPPSKVAFKNPGGIAVDGLSGAMYIADTGAHVVRFAINNIMRTFAGTCTVASSTGDGGYANASTLNNPTALALRPDGALLYITETIGNRIRVVNVSSGIISTLMGTGVAGSSGDGGLAIGALLTLPRALCVDYCGNVFVGDSTKKIRVINASTGLVATTTGTGAADTWPGGNGDGGAALLAWIYYPTACAIDKSGNLYIADGYMGRIRAITPGGTSACAPPSSSPSPSPTPSKSPTPSNSLTPSNTPWAAGVARIHTVFGGVSDIGAPAYVPIYRPSGGGTVTAPVLSSDCAGGFLVATYYNAVRRISKTGNTSLIIGNPWSGPLPSPTGNGILAINNPSGSSIGYPSALTCNASGYFIYESLFSRLRFVSSASGLVNTIVGNSSVCNLDAAPSVGSVGVPATSVCLGLVVSLAFNGSRLTTCGLIIKSYTRSKI
jgi:hypothetical protein